MICLERNLADSIRRFRSGGAGAGASGGFNPYINMYAQLTSSADGRYHTSNASSYNATLNVDGAGNLLTDNVSVDTVDAEGKGDEVFWSGLLGVGTSAEEKGAPQFGQLLALVLTWLPHSLQG